MKFSKAYEPNQYEPDIYALWESSNAFAPSSDPASDPYTIVMPPPNANGNLHIGHGLTIALEDILTRFHRLQGESAWYIPGADHAGFETWVVYEKLLERAGKSRFDYTRDELYSQVWDFVQEQRGNMELQVRALGASCDWSSFTFTLDPKVIDTVYVTFQKLWEDQLVYRGEKLVNFCVKHQTAFADIEVVHKEDKGKLWDIAYPLANPANGITEVIISTTRPETLLGDTAVAVNPEDPRYKKMISKKVKLPLTDREIPIIADAHADTTFGTGAVKITPAHDPNDFEVAGRHNLPLITVIGFDGKMTAEAGANYEGLTVLEARKKVLKDLENLGLLRGDKTIVHSVGHCYKCDSVIEPLLKDQWFIKVRPLADRAIAALEADEIKFKPASKKQALIHYLKNLKDWNISRQIPWGIPIPAFQNSTDPTDWIFDTRVDLPEIAKASHTYIRDNDTFDTWFSSGQWPIITTLSRPSHYPTSVMETGSDLLFPWISRMIMLGLYATNDIPFKDVYMHGMVLDEKAQKMSKSKGNVINPMEIISAYGSDAFRIGIIASRSAGVNQAFSVSKVIAGRNLCNKLWNISRFIQHMVDENSDASSTNITTEHMGEDWICQELTHCSKKVKDLIGKYRFAEASELLYDTIWNKYADWFLETQKIYKNLPLLRKTLEHILIMLHPFAPFVTETIWQNLSWTTGLLISQKWPSELTSDPMSASQFESLIIIISTLRAHFQSLPGAKRYPVLFGQDSLVDDHQLLIQFLTKAPSVTSTDLPKGLRLAIPNHEIYLDIPEKVLNEHQKNLEDRIMELGREIDTLTLRLSNPNYLAKAPQHLVEESQKQQSEKESLLEKMKQELSLIK
ncbi:MAG: valine--tRNA ligase [Candidatus Nomurabacteria bacterium]|jgi:valyl-tRNA synthetase|nr:valine--tRNA ligase [Candidatus Nomurabacteria bacterium]